MKDRLKILYIGSDYLGSHGTTWRDAFLELGHEVRTIDSQRMVSLPKSLWGKVRLKVVRRAPSGQIKRLNQIIIKECRDFKPNLIFFVRADYVFAETLAEVRKFGRNFGYMHDDMFNPKNQTFTFYKAIPHMDAILTTRRCNVPEFYNAGASLAFFIPFAYDPKIHHPASLSAAERENLEGDVALLGTFRPERADFLAGLANCHGEFKFNLWGGGWEKMKRPIYFHKWKNWHQLEASFRGTELWCAEMAKAIQANKICLGLLNHANRDLHTLRTFEIPACGGFMLAERTEEHRQLFEEDREAVYFDSFEEMLDKIRYYLSNDTKRRRIAEAGYQRCMRSPYRYVDRARFAIQLFHQIR